MDVTTFYTIGSFTFPSSWAAIIVAFIVAYIAIRIWYGKQHAVRLADAFFYVIIVWKLSVVLLDFKMILRAPLGIVYFNGGIAGFVLSLLFVMVKTWIDWHKGKLAHGGIEAMLVGSFIAQSVFQVIVVLLNKGSLSLFLLTIMLFTASLIYIIKGLRKTIRIPLIWLFVAVHLFLSAFMPQGLHNFSLHVTVMIAVFFSFLIWNEERKLKIKGESF